ncbi:mechanosensitive ion channel domain-containing protein [Erythrobacter sp.]|uniref:mechanosensitive ion channel family protein n=1 Tax=Erythrobacter sp. TaxID=1042 RepID=UPI003C75F49C
MRRFSVIWSFVLLGFLLASPMQVAAQLPLGGPQDEATAEPTDPFERETPRSSVSALIRALAQREYVRAGNYFAVDGEDPERAAALARALQAALDQGGTLVPFSELSRDPLGSLQDELAPNLERIGQLGGPGDVPILLSRSEPSAANGDEASPEATQDVGEAPIWQIAPETIEQLEQRADGLGAPDPVSGFLIAGAPIGDWAFLIGLFVATFLGFWLISWILQWLVQRAIRNHEESGFYRFLHAAIPPFSLLLAVIAFRVWGSEAPVAIVARQLLLRYLGIVAWIALAWLAIRLVDAIAGKLTNKLDARERRQAASGVTLARRAVKLLLVIIAVVAILDTLGIDITTGVAALGIGGLALALGAQKTIENLVGSVTVVADRPIEVGDFCKVGDVLGTVEDIGMRSTRIRTLERTLVTIPNGDFSSRQIENYAQRDRFLFRVVVGLEYAVSAAQLQQGVDLIEAVLIEHEQVLEDPRRVKLKDFGASSLDIEAFAYLDVTDLAESLEIRHDLLMTIYARLEEAGLSIAFPTQTVYLRPEDEAAAS